VLLAIATARAVAAADLRTRDGGQVGGEESETEDVRTSDPCGAAEKDPPGPLDPGEAWAQVADHFIDVLEGARAEPAMEGVLGPDRTRAEYEALLTELENLGTERAARIAAVNPTALERPVRDPRFGDTTLWWVIARGCLDHETHHRGQLAAWLRDVLRSSR